MASPRILRADLSHLDGLAELFDGYRQFYRKPPDLAAARAFLKERIELDESVIFAATLPGADALAGFTQLYPFFSSVRMRRLWILNDLFVAPDARQRGVARALMEAARAYASSTGAASLELATEITNTSAQALYEDLGYARDDEFYHYALTL
ncbi:MAG: GNAT family N-acetyltransferase [Bacteroidota bacterium]